MSGLYGVYKLYLEDGIVGGEEGGGGTPLQLIPIVLGSVKLIAGGVKSGHVDGPALEAKFNGIGDVAYDPQDDSMYITDTDNHVIRKLSQNGMNSRDLST